MADVIDVFKGLPRRVHVGHATFRIVVCAPADSVHLADENDGCTVLQEYKIFLNNEMHLQAAVEVVQHEVTHAINWVYGVDDDSTEEQFTTQHSKGQLEVWMRNPRLLNWIVKQLRLMKKQASRD